MLPSMPILFTRDSQDAFGNKIEPGTSFFNQNWFEKPVIIKEPDRSQPELVPSTSSANNARKPEDKNKEQTSEEKSKENALETALVRSFYTKVQSKFSTHMNLPSNKFVQFQNVLKTFDPNKETPVDLYKKIEDLFGESHKDLVEEFLLFLKPGQAAEVGRFMDYFMLAQLTGFIELLQTTFARKPTVLRKVLRAITTGINSGSSADMKNRVLPHLRSNPRLTKMFKALFPDERPPDSVYETGTDMIGESFLTGDRGYDAWELAEGGDTKRALGPTEAPGTTYLHGRVFLQHGRMLRSARVTFPYSKEPYRVHSRRLAPNNHCVDSPPQSDDERASPKRQSKITPKIPTKKPKKQLKSPTKTPKDFNDNTNIINSPKTTKKQTAKAKTLNKKDDNKDTNKKDKKIDARIQNNKKDDAKNRQAHNNNNIKEIKSTVSNINPVSNANLVTHAKIVTNVNAVTVANVITNANVVTNINAETDANLITHANLVTQANLVPKTTPVTKTNEITNKMDRKINMDAKIMTNQDKNQVATAINGDKKSEAKANWTRDEDKTMLQVLKGEPGSEQIFIKISELLPHRSVNEIKERFCEVMSLLQQMAVGEVT